MKPRRHVIAMFVVYLVLLAWLVLFKLEAPFVGEAWQHPRPIKLVPFVASGDANASSPLEVLANVLFFVPFGAYLGVLVRWRWFVIAGVLAASSVVLEAVQHVLSVGSFDTTDVIANTAGGLLGLLLARVISTTMMTRVLVIGTLLALVAAAAFIASPLQYHAPRDVVLR